LQLIATEPSHGCNPPEETAAEAEVAGPCHVEPDPQGGWAVLLAEESIAAGGVPMATFLRKEAALVAAAVLPGTARRLRYRLGDDPCERGFPVLLGGAMVGHCRVFHEALAAAMTVVDALLASPGDFASGAGGEGLARSRAGAADYGGADEGELSMPLRGTREG
jgi:hypothetical protein